MKFLHTSDWHVGKAVRGRSRAAEHQAVLREIADVADAESVDLVVVAGDVFDTATPTAEAERIVYRALLDLAAGGRPVVVIAGNHDSAQRLAAVAPLSEASGIHVASAIKPPDDGGVLELTADGRRTLLALVPFPSQRYVVTADDLLAGGADQHNLDYRARVGRILAALTSGFRGDTVNLVAAHLTVMGGALGGGERGAHTVFDYWVPAVSFPSAAHYVALGHLHRVQRLDGPAPLHYSGSPLQLDFGEVANQPSVNVVEARPGVPARVRQVALTSGKRLRTLRGTLADVLARADGPGMADAHLRVVLDEASRAGLADEVRAAVPHAVEVVLAPREDELRAHRSDPDRLRRTPHDLFAEYLTEHEVTDPRLVRLFDTLVDEASTSPDGGATGPEPSDTSAVGSSQVRRRASASTAAPAATSARAADRSAGAAADAEVPDPDAGTAAPPSSPRRATGRGVAPAAGDTGRRAGADPGAIAGRDAEPAPVGSAADSTDVAPEPAASVSDDEGSMDASEGARVIDIRSRLQAAVFALDEDEDEDDEEDGDEVPFGDEAAPSRPFLELAPALSPDDLADEEGPADTDAPIPTPLTLAPPAGTPTPQPPASPDDTQPRAEPDGTTVRKARHDERADAPDASPAEAPATGESRPDSEAARAAGPDDAVDPGPAHGTRSDTEGASAAAPVDDIASRPESASTGDLPGIDADVEPQDGGDPGALASSEDGWLTCAAVSEGEGSPRHESAASEPVPSGAAPDGVGARSEDVAAVDAPTPDGADATPVTAADEGDAASPTGRDVAEGTPSGGEAASDAGSAGDEPAADGRGPKAASGGTKKASTKATPKKKAAPPRARRGRSTPGRRGQVQWTELSLLGDDAAGATGGAAEPASGQADESVTGPDGDTPPARTRRRRPASAARSRSARDPQAERAADLPDSGDPSDEGDGGADEHGDPALAGVPLQGTLL